MIESAAGKPAAKATAADTALIAIMGLGILAGVLIRSAYVLRHDFPVNDGGMFFQMADELRASQFLLPMFTSYNDTAIPYAYPPLGFYAAAILAQATGFDLMRIVQVLPLIVTILTIPAFALLARALFTDRLTVWASVFAFALIPRTFLWFIMGGGLTRSFGLLFSILALQQAHAAFARQSAKARWGAALCLALTALSHLGIVPFAVSGIVLMWAFHGRSRAGFTTLVIIGAGALVLSSPWWLTVMARHGIAPFLAANATGGSVFSSAEGFKNFIVPLAYLAVGGGWGGSTGEVLFPVLGTIALLGGVYLAANGRFFLPAWWLLVLAVDARSGQNYATVPVALLAGIGLREVLFPLVTPERARMRTGLLGARYAALIGFLLVYAVMSFAVERPSMGTDLRSLRSLTAEERGAMGWVAEHTPPSSSFLVIPRDRWGVDRASEWFPVLARRQSVATVQGTEWLSDGAFATRRSQFITLEGCRNGLSTCLDDWATTTGLSFTHVFVPEAGVEGPPCCSVLIASLQRDPRYREVFAGPGAKVFERLSREAAY